VKITGDASPSSPLISDAVTPAPDMSVPDPCVSSDIKTTAPAVSSEMVAAPVSPNSIEHSSDTSLFVEEIDQENELGAFLLDAVEWL